MPVCSFQDVLIETRTHLCYVHEGHKISEPIHRFLSETTRTKSISSVVIYSIQSISLHYIWLQSENKGINLKAHNLIVIKFTIQCHDIITTIPLDKCPKYGSYASERHHLHSNVIRYRLCTGGGFLTAVLESCTLHPRVQSRSGGFRSNGQQRNFWWYIATGK